MPVTGGGNETRMLLGLDSPGISDVLDAYRPFWSGVALGVCLHVLVANLCQMSAPSTSIYIDLG